MKHKQLTSSDWSTISTDEAYKLENSKFQGMVIQSLQDLRNGISEIKQDQNVQRYITFTIAAVSGILSGLVGTRIPH